MNDVHGWEGWLLRRSWEAVDVQAIDVDLMSGRQLVIP